MESDDPSSVLSQLGSFALTEVFKDLGLDFERDSLSSVHSQLGLEASTRGSTSTGDGLSKDLVYDGKFVDDDDDEEEEEEEGDEDGSSSGEDGESEVDDDDLERQVDQEMYDESHTTRPTLPLSTTTVVSKATTLVRGEEDDFDDDDDDDDDDDQAKETGTTDTTTAKDVEMAHTRQDTILESVKAEPCDEDTTTTATFDPLPTIQEVEPTPLVDRLGPAPPPTTLPLPSTSTTTDPTPSTTTLPPPPTPFASMLDPLPVSMMPVAPPMPQYSVKELFPSFEYGHTLDFTELFAVRPRKRAKKATWAPQFTLPPGQEIQKAKSTRDILVQPMTPLPPTSYLKQLLSESQYKETEEWEEEGGSEDELYKAIERSNRMTVSKWKIPDSSHTFDNAELDNWEDKIVWGPDTAPRALINDPLAPRNIDFDRGDWTKSIIWDASRPYKDFTRLNLNLNDRQMILEVQAPTTTFPMAESDQPAEATTIGLVIDREPGLDPFNISNDREYVVTKDAKQKIRQTFGSLEVQHAHPAAKLQLPFYKTRMTKNDMRSFHRPTLQFPQNVPLSFDKSRSSKKKKDALGKKVKGNELRHMIDITLKDTAPFVLWEYSEETPPIISNVGMGSIIVNYYRKREPTDKFVPNLDLGEPLILEGTDESPFKAFGYVHPGQTVPALYNNLIRAPLFRHRPPTTDFLICRVTIEGETKYYIREIKNMFVLGQTYPLTEVPGPHSRKVTTLVKNRLQNITFKLIEKNPHHRIKVHRLTRYFPDQNDLQMRQRLKEFMEFNRKGPNQGFWMIKKSVAVPDDAEMMKLATPEMVCLAESMQVGLRHLQDAGYGAAAEEGGAGDDDSKLDIEQQLAPWITTKNFINATANKAMLKLHGEGDPTGRGEAFSFLRTSMKDIFLRAGELMEERLAQMESRPKSAHRYNVQEQQDVYKEEIARIWKAQWDSLRNPIEPELTAEDEERARGAAATTAANEKMAKIRQRQERHGTTSLMDHGTPGGPGTPGPGGGSRASSPAETVGSGAGGEKQAKTLRIKRLIEGKWETEIVRDPTIISAYVRQRKMIEEEKTEADDLLPSDDEGKNERARKRLKEQLEKLKRNQERRLARKSAKLGVPISQVNVGGKGYVKTETTRICGNCGQRGHMKTSKKLCPRWHEFNAPKGPEPSSTLGSGFGGGLALPSLGGGGGGPSGPKGGGGKAGSPPPPPGGATMTVGTPSASTPTMTTAAPAKSTLKFKLSTNNPGSASSPPAAPGTPSGDAPIGEVEHF
ncbi:BQ2448_3312 [Microbotryum intermedium]|uniref:BQ2448_3312 protein n=1 Tax=Microbotryum intermedium TaxID=269621 RepID=A0A238F9P0_9BASI|nr:BQ2448_3312 [Microbotryum intermedium]